MNAELIYMLELARSLDRFVREIDASQEKQRDVASNCGGRSGPELAFDRAIRRGKEAVIAMLTKATRELVPLDGEEMGKFLRSLEYGEIPEGAFFTTDIANEECAVEMNGRARGNARAHTGKKPARVSRQAKNGAEARRLHEKHLRKSADDQSLISARVGARGTIAGGHKSARASRSKKKIISQESRNAGPAAAGSGTKGSSVPDSISTVDPLLPSDAKSREAVSLYKEKSWGSYGEFEIEILVAATTLPDLNQREIREASYSAKDLITAAVMSAVVRDNKDAQNRKHAERRELLALFPEPIFVEEIPNGYCSSWCCRHLPWFVVTTTVGRFTIGWRKRVVEIDWSTTRGTKTAQELFRTDNVTKGERMIHAWSCEDAKRYVETVLATAAD